MIKDLVYKTRYFILKHQTGFVRIERLYYSIFPQLLLPTEACALYKLAKESTGPIVEIGSYVGGSTVILAEGSARGNKVEVYAIDPHLGYLSEGHLYPDTKAAFEYNIRKTVSACLINPVYNYSSLAVKDCPDGIGLLFVDGDHSFEAVKKDLSLYKRKLSPDGVIVLHDYKKESVRNACNEELLIRINVDVAWQLVGRTKTLAVFRRKK